MKEILCIVAAALVLTACGGGGGGSSGGASDPAETQRAAITLAIQTARTEVDGLDELSTDADLAAAAAAIEAAKGAVSSADALSDEEIDGYGVTLDLLEGLFEPRRAQIAAGRLGEARRLLSGFGGPRIDAIAAKVRHGRAPVISGTVLGTPPKPVRDIATARVPGSGSTADGWAGGIYTASDESAGTVDRVAFHTDIEAPGSRPFSGEGGRYTVAPNGSLAIGAETDATLIVAPAFPTTAGILEHPADQGGVAQVVGSFDGAEGAYVCTPAEGSPCTSSVKHGGGIALAGGGGWAFVPAPDATVAEPDASYRYFGWWRRESGGAYFVGTFHAGIGAAADEFAGLRAVQGDASYRGPAAGLFAIAGEDAGSSGSFAATARLTARFGDAAAIGTVIGTVDGFTVDGEPMPWTVTLDAAGIGAAGSIAASGADTARTVWSIDGEPDEAPSGTPPTWRGQFHEAGADRVPVAATGTFEASRGDTARMIGAFGTSRRR